MYSIAALNLLLSLWPSWFRDFIHLYSRKQGKKRTGENEISWNYIRMELMRNKYSTNSIYAEKGIFSIDYSISIH